jgi:hypothetical protein
VPDQLINLLSWVHAGATWFMVGLIWFVQIVHYPLMGVISAKDFCGYAAAHQRRTTWVVGPVMFVEAITAFLLAFSSLEPLDGVPVRGLGVALLVVIWVSTFAVQVPLHTKLEVGFDTAVWQRLVATNWLRTVAWTLRGVIALLLLQ